ncbi:MAG: hydrogenase maturation protease [Acidimicrobiales bacterium]
MTTLVIGVGNRDRGDDGAGPAVADRVRARGLRALVLEGDLSDLALRWRPDDRVIVVDAVRTGADPGTVHRVSPEVWGTLPSAAPWSSHGVGVRDALGLASLFDLLPASLEVIGIEMAGDRLGTGLSEPVREAVDRVAQAISTSTLDTIASTAVPTASS